jgi:hypothetical protein
MGLADTVVKYWLIGLVVVIAFVVIKTTYRTVKARQATGA